MVVAITGASAGIGRAMAERLARDGAAVVLHGAARGTAGRGRERHHQSRRPRAGDAGRRDGRGRDGRASWRRPSTEFGRLDVMICNAGIGFHGRLADTPAAAAEKLVEVNVLGTIHAARAAAVSLRAPGAGHLIAISSIVGLSAACPGGSVYSATKAAQKAFIESLRSEWMGTGLHASVVFPISTRTEFHDAMHEISATRSRASARVRTRTSSRTLSHAASHSPRPEVYPYRLAWWLRLANTIAPSSSTVSCSGTSGAASHTGRIRPHAGR